MMAYSDTRAGCFRSRQGLILIDLPVAQYYDQYPLQLAHDFPTEPQNRLWRHIGGLLDQGQREGVPAPASPPVRAADVAPVLAAFEADGRLRTEDRRRWAQREALRVLRARQLGLPEQHPGPLASEDEVRRARMHVA